MFLVAKSNLSSHFRSTKPKPPHIPKPYLLAAQSFNQKIIHHLKTLDPPPDSSHISLSWLSAAVSFISTVHSEAAVQISNLKSDASGSDDYQDLFMDYSLKVLDLCNLISSAINRLTDRRILLNFSLLLLNFSDQTPPVEKLNKAKDAIDRSVVNNTDESVKEKGVRAKTLINELAVLIGNLPRGKINGGEDRERDLIRRMFYATGVLTVFVGSVLVTVLFGELDLVRLRVPSEFDWADSVNGVENRIFDLMKMKNNVVLEVDDVTKQAVVVRDLVEVVVNGEGDDGVRVRLQDGVKEMMIGVKKLSDGIDELTDGVNGMFRTVLNIRNGRLDV